MRNGVMQICLAPFLCEKFSPFLQENCFNCCIFVIGYINNFNTMRRLLILAGFNLFFFFIGFAIEPFRFAFFTDLHISVLKPQNADDLKLVVDDVNKDGKFAFVLIDGDDSDLGDTISLKIAKNILSDLKIPYYITSGNHDTKQGEIGSTNFIRVFGNDKFSFISNGYKFIGFPTGPVIAHQKGHIKKEDLDFVKSELKLTDPKIPVFLVTHYPLLEGDIDNRLDLIDILHVYKVKAVLGGHYHRNVLLNYDEIPGIVNRSVLRVNQPAAGYSIYSISDSLKVSEKNIGHPEINWLTLPLQN